MNTIFVDNTILRLCIQPRTFEFISKSLDGLDPIKVTEALSHLEETNRITKKDDLWVITDIYKPTPVHMSVLESQLYLKKYMGYFDFLKTPHPLDFEWRNSTDSLIYLVEEIQKSNRINERILLLGMPTLFASAYSKDIPQAVTLVEKNKPIVESLTKLVSEKSRFQILEADIFSVSPERVGSYHSIIMDPPWYSPHFFQFMWLAAQCVEVGGIVGISLPPINTRPGIPSERIGWLTFCESLGLCIENLFSQKLNYTMPFFEFNAFRAAGISNILPFWRKGDLAYFRKVELKNIPRPDLVISKNEWIEREIDNVRLRLKQQSNYPNSPLTIENIIKGDILPTVSTRDPRRENANIWTSGNRIFRVNNIQVFIDQIDNLDSESGIDSHDRKVVSDFLQMVGGLEKKEYNNYLDWLYHEMEKQIN